jgi:hypothetical protein
MMQFKEVNGKDMIHDSINKLDHDLFSTRDKQLEKEKNKDKEKDSQSETLNNKPKKERKPRTPKKKN